MALLLLPGSHRHCCYCILKNIPSFPSFILHLFLQFFCILCFKILFFLRLTLTVEANMTRFRPFCFAIVCPLKHILAWNQNCPCAVLHEQHIIHSHHFSSPPTEYAINVVLFLCIAQQIVTRSENYALFLDCYLRFITVNLYLTV